MNLRPELVFDLQMTLLSDASIWQRVVDVFTTPGLTLFLLLGSFVLAISLLLLTMTRLGHARPITKCVVLSVIAHFLLLGYAYGTKLIFQLPAEQRADSINVNLVEYDADEEGESTEPASRESVDQFATNTPAAESGRLERPELERPFELERVVDVELLNENAPWEHNDRKIEIAKLKLESPLFKIDAPDIDLDDPDRGDEVVMEPQEIEFERRGEGVGDVKTHEPEFEKNNSEIDVSNEMDSVELEPGILNDDAFPSEEERSQQFESELILPDSENAIVDEFVAETTAERQQPDTQGQDLSTQLQQSAPFVPPVPTRRLADGQLMPEAFRLRAATNRAAAAKTRGGSDETENAVEASLKWLASIQKADGRWDPIETGAGSEDKVFGHDRGGCGSNAGTGITALATLAFLGAGHTHLEGEYQDTVQRALEFLARKQAKDGDLSGEAKLFARMYCHSMSLLALSEALAITGDHRLKESVGRGVGYTVQAQNKKDGGWRYQPGDSGDMSQFGWKVMALHSAALGGVSVEAATKSRMNHFLASCQTGDHGGLASYRTGQGPSTTMTAEALVCKYFMRQSVTKNSLNEARQRILAELPSTSSTNLYYWYYATLALYHSGGEAWQQWNAELQRVLLSQQETSGSLKGSWPPDGIWAGYGGRVYSTALATLCLEVYYRYLPADEGVAGDAVSIPDNRVDIPR